MSYPQNLIIPARCLITRTVNIINIKSPILVHLTLQTRRTETLSMLSQCFFSTLTHANSDAIFSQRFILCNQSLTNNWTPWKKLIQFRSRPGSIDTAWYSISQYSFCRSSPENTFSKPASLTPILFTTVYLLFDTDRLTV